MSGIFQRIKSGTPDGGKLSLICCFCRMKIWPHKLLQTSSHSLTSFEASAVVGSIASNGCSSNKRLLGRSSDRTVATRRGSELNAIPSRRYSVLMSNRILLNHPPLPSDAATIDPYHCAIQSTATHHSGQLIKALSRPFSVLSPSLNFHRTLTVCADSVRPLMLANPNLQSTSTACADAQRPLSVSSQSNTQRSLISHASATAQSEPVVQDKYATELSDALLAGERWALARAITLVEATNKKGRRRAQVLLRRVLGHLREEQLRNKGVPSSFRIGLTGPPGAGKSTFIEAMGKRLTAEGHRVAVLAVDPSSSITGGSLLGDKTRMTELSRDPNAYIRASPSSGTLGGVTRNTNDAILLCEASGYDIILVETVGVGQSEYVVADMVDMLVLLVPPAGGDELQGLKKGIVERADFILVNKADGELLIPARRMRSEYTSAVKFMYKRSPLWSPKVKQVSSKTGDGMSKAWDVVEEYRGIMVESGEFGRKRQRQRRVWMWQHIKDKMMEEFMENQRLKNDIRMWEEEVMAGRCTAGIAADELLKRFSKISRDV